MGERSQFFASVFEIRNMWKNEHDDFKYSMAFPRSMSFDTIHREVLGVRL